ncbi:MAG TPA: NRDE family protein [Oleiagrimonas sp.]|nr:NRDE family protein [Oleiagrimonas sp.]
MCLIAFAWNVHPRWRLLLLGNRDEAHARPSAPLAHWDDVPRIMAGRDLEAGGTWMGVDQHGRAGVVTNVRDPAAGKSGASRGLLIADYLRDEASATAYAQHLLTAASGYRPFNLLVFDADRAFYLGNQPAPRLQVVKAGVHGLSNADFNAPWPKTQALTARLQAWIDAGGDDDFAPLFEGLADDSCWPDDVLPDTGVGIELERRLSAAFIRGERYGTRASTIIAVDHAGAGCIIERCFGANGVAQGETRIDFPRTAGG